MIAGSTRLNVNPPIDATRDWALLRLAQPLCKNGYFKVSRRPVEEVMRLADQGRVYNVAYHRDLPKWQPMVGRDCSVRRNFAEVDWPTIRRDFADAEQLLLHTCDTGGASSGSPLLADGPDGPEVVGINVGTYVQSKVIMLNGEVVHRFQSDDVANTGVNSQAFAAALDAFTNADLLASQSDIRLLQAALAAQGPLQRAARRPLRRGHEGGDRELRARRGAAGDGACDAAAARTRCSARARSSREGSRCRSRQAGQAPQP